MIVRTFDDFLNNVEVLEKEYKGILCSFFDERERNNNIRKWKNMIYSIKCKRRVEYKKDVLWRYLNGELEYEELVSVLKRNF